MALFSHNAALGFWLQDEALEAALIWPKRNGWKVAGQSNLGEAGLLAAPDRRDRLARAFRQSVKKLPRTARRADLGAMIAIPDKYVEEEALNFAEFPKARKETQALVTHRMARELGATAEDIAVSWDEFASETGTVCRTRALDAVLRADIEAAASSAGVRLTRIDAWTAFASAAPEFRELSNGAAVWSDGTEWSLLCWSKNDPVGFCQQGALNAGVAENVVRMSQSYAVSHGLDAFDLVTDVPTILSDALAAKAHAAGLSLRRFATEATRAERVAAWG